MPLGIRGREKGVSGAYTLACSMGRCGCVLGVCTICMPLLAVPPLSAQLGKMGAYVSRPLFALWGVGWFLFAGVSNMGMTRCGEGVSFSHPLFAGGLVTRTRCGLLCTGGMTCCRFGGYPLPLVPGFKTD